MTKSNLVRIIISLTVVGVVMFFITNKNLTNKEISIQPILEVETK